MKKRVLFLFLVLISGLTLAACGKGGFKFAKNNVTVEVGKTETVAFSVPAEDAGKLEVTSGDVAIATATLDGKNVKVTGVAIGKTEVTVKVKESDKSIKLTVNVIANQSGARFEGADRKILLDISQDFTVALADALASIKAYDEDGTDITDNIELDGLDIIDLTQGVGATFEIQLSVKLKSGEVLRKVITIELYGVLKREPVVIFGPSKLTHYIGNDGFDFIKEFSAQNIETGEELEVTAEFPFGETIALSNPGETLVTLSAKQGDVEITRAVTLTTKPKVEIKSELRGTTAATPIEIIFGHGNGQTIEPLFKEYAGWFEEEMLKDGVHVKVEVSKYGDDYDMVRDTITKAMQSGDKLPNIIQNYPDHLFEYNQHKKIVSLSPYVFHPTWGLGDAENESFYDIIQSYRDEQRAASLEGDMLSMPFNKSTEVVIYNKDMFDEVLKGDPFPRTWEDLMELGPQLKAIAQTNIDNIANAYQRAGNSTYTDLVKKAALDEFYAFSYDSGGNAFITLTKGWGGTYTQQTGTKEEKLAFVNDQTRQMLTYFGENRDHFTTPAVWNNARYATDFFLKGYSAFSVSSSAGADKNTPMVGTTKVFNAELAPMLYSKLNPDHRNVIQQGTNFAITTEGDDDQKIVSWLFLKFLNTQKVGHDYAVSKGYYPTRNSTLASPEYLEFLAKADQRIVDGMPKKDADVIMRAKAAKIYFEQRQFLTYDLPFKGSSTVRSKVEVAFKDVLLTAPGADLAARINSALQTAFDESARGLTDD